MNIAAVLTFPRKEVQGFLKQSVDFQTIWISDGATVVKLPASARIGHCRCFRVPEQVNSLLEISHGILGYKSIADPFKN